MIVGSVRCVYETGAAPPWRDGRTHVLPSPLLVVATLNPLERAGTYALPEAPR
ncbi:AAA family ATPase, partial [Microbacterium sp. IEGM 1404]|uniref:AAA family ATPase n=1 Tax=Microbacterium sp. IEGM 1404 TaxID=3047084 RepID=UPI0035A85DF0